MKAVFLGYRVSLRAIMTNLLLNSPEETVDQSSCKRLFHSIAPLKETLPFK